MDVRVKRKKGLHDGGRNCGMMDLLQMSQEFNMNNRTAGNNRITALYERQLQVATVFTNLTPLNVIEAAQICLKKADALV